VHTGFWWGDLMEGGHLEDLGVDGRILKWILKKWDVGHELDLCGSGQGQLEGTCESGSKPSGSIKCGESLD